MEKRFDEWMDLKADLHKKIKIPPQVNSGDIWWASIGENIGSEINGKNRNFTRISKNIPLIVKRLAIRGRGITRKSKYIISNTT